MRNYDPSDPMRIFHEPDDPLDEISIYIKLSMPRRVNADMVAQFIEDLKQCMEAFEHSGTHASMEVDQTITL